MLRAALPGRPLQNRTVVQWDIGAVLKRDGAADESVSLQSGIIPKLADPDSCCVPPLGRSYERVR